MKIRNYTSSDVDEVIKLFYDTVHTVNASDFHASKLDAIKAVGDAKATVGALDEKLGDYRTGYTDEITAAKEKWRAEYDRLAHIEIGDGYQPEIESRMPDAVGAFADAHGGAMAQTVGHDSHNVTVIGDNARDMLLAVAALGENGGFAVSAGGKVTAAELDIAGLMSSRGVSEALSERRAVSRAASALCSDKEIEPLMLLSFLTLTVIPEVKLNTKGLFDVNGWKYVYKNEGELR